MKNAEATMKKLARAYTFTQDDIDTQTKQLEAVLKNGGIADYGNEYALLYYMKHGTIPERDDYAWPLEKPQAIARIAEYLLEAQSSYRKPATSE